MLKRRALPMLLLMLGLWLLAGCFYLPVPQHQVGVKIKDLRTVVGDRNSKRPLKVGQATRQQVIALLGNPPFASRDERSVAYVMETESGAWVFPLCFSASPGEARRYAMRLDFDGQGILEGWELADDQEPHDLVFTVVHMGAYDLISRIRRPDRTLLPTRSQTAADVGH
jgi:hypothetical protein